MQIAAPYNSLLRHSRTLGRAIRYGEFFVCERLVWRRITYRRRLPTSPSGSVMTLRCCYAGRHKFYVDRDAGGQRRAIIWRVLNGSIARIACAKVHVCAVIFLLRTTYIAPMFVRSDCRTKRVERLGKNKRKNPVAPSPLPVISEWFATVCARLHSCARRFRLRRY